MDTPSSNNVASSSETFKEKLALGRSALPADFTSGLPDTYGDNRLVTMARDPFTIFCYWEFTPDRIAALRQSAGQDAWEAHALVLRAYDRTDQPSNDLTDCPFFDVDLPDKQARKWYLKVPLAGRHYQVELGLRLSDGRFFPILASNRVSMPFGKISDQTDSRFMAVSAGTVQEEWKKFQDIAGNLASLGRGSHELAKTMAQRWEFLKSVFSGSSSWSSTGRLQNSDEVAADEEKS